MSQTCRYISGLGRLKAPGPQASSEQERELYRHPWLYGAR